ncbi:MAG: hypothetical protein H7317_08025 [Pseudorhodobacter sp.]|nr:hypothetical protein [Pseudorhodobacter sp.]
MRALDRKLWRDLRRIWAQTLAIALVLGCGVMVLVLSSGTLKSLSETRAAYYERQRFADVFASAIRAPQRVIPAIAALDGAAQVDAQIVLLSVLDLDGMIEPATAQIGLLKAVGYSTRDIATHYLKMSLASG